MSYDRYPSRRGPLMIMVLGSSPVLLSLTQLRLHPRRVLATDNPCRANPAPCIALGIGKHLLLLRRALRVRSLQSRPLLLLHPPITVTQVTLLLLRLACLLPAQHTIYSRHRREPSCPVVNVQIVRLVQQAVLPMARHLSLQEMEVIIPFQT